MLRSNTVSPCGWNTVSSMWSSMPQYPPRSSMAATCARLRSVHSSLRIQYSSFRSHGGPGWVSALGSYLSASSSSSSSRLRGDESSRLDAYLSYRVSSDASPSLSDACGALV